MAKKVVKKSTPAKKNSAVKTPIKKAVKTAKPVASPPAKKKAAAPKPVLKKALDKKEKAAAKPAKVLKKALVVEKVLSPEKSLPAPKASKSDKKIVVEAKPLPEIVNPDKLKPVRSILISQPKPESGKSPYVDIAEQFKIKLDWRPFTRVDGIKGSDFRKQKIYIDQYPCVIFTSRVAIEQYFRICEELRVKINEDNRYFCLSETIALYLQKFIQYRKRKVFYGDGKLPKLIEVILKHKEDGKFLLPCSDQRDKALIELLTRHNIPYNEAIIYNTAASDLSDLEDVKYDMLVFFNSLAIDSLYTNFPKFKQDETRLAIFGNGTAETVKGHKLNINVFAPTPENPSLVDAIRKYIIVANKKGK